MKISLIVIGKTEEAYIKEGINVYIQRLKHYITFEIIEIPSIKNTKNMSPSKIVEKEGELLLKQIKKHEYCILLDEKGRSFRSVEFAEFIESKINQSTRSIAFVVGGAYGFSPDVYNIAKMKLSLSDMTFSHQMIRLFFLEQLYRAFTIIKNEPYHNE